MKKRRYLALLLVVSMLGISACGSKEKEAETPAEPAKTQESADASEEQEKSLRRKWVQMKQAVFAVRISMFS